MKLDSIYLAVFCCVQLVLFSAISRFVFPNFFAAYNFIIWAVVCAIGFAAYPWLQSLLHGSAHVHLFPVLAHLTVIFALSTAFSFVVIGYTASDGFAEWQLGLFFIVVPSAIASFIALLISYAFFYRIQNA